MEIDLKEVPVVEILSDETLFFSESGGRFVITVDPRNREKFESEMRGLPVRCVGVVRGDAKFKVRGRAGVMEEDIFSLKKSWQEPLRKG